MIICSRFKKLMKKNISKSYNFNIYAKYLNSQKRSNHTINNLHHNINIDSVCADIENFYALNPTFFVEECNMAMKSQNGDYTKYMKWMLDD